DYRLITLPEHDVRTYQPPTNVYGILAAPPCTEFSFARVTKGRDIRPTDFRSGLEIVNACLKIIQEAICLQWDAHNWQGFKFWAMENPKGYLEKFMGEPALEFQACDFGDMWKKPTCIWGKFNQPRKFQQRVMTCGDMTDWTNGEDRAALRAITPPGFARAFYQANK
ncbi:MAG: hypothetical protein WC454_08110, partial [Phycisphaerae bacterium]